MNWKRRTELPEREAVLRLSIESKAGGKRLVYLSALPRVDDALLEELKSTDLLLLDGTFWADDELVRVNAGKRASEMRHLPISGLGGSRRNGGAEAASVRPDWLY